ncbi:hypothetical protein Pla100_56350 [Neorhodopirellula pilleata]|uniref:Uncharacterized protein n=2 Tax=Neorhodopirellula pilleata TaxID=2714738 RepID=A0A5C5ZQI5_9BACT|nr:hypothetical protein Pla100_56350 [Neorhodopirellula pilleata]
MLPSPNAVKLYKRWLSTAREERSETAIPNELPWHSRCAVAELTRFALECQQSQEDSQTEIRLFTGTITSNVYDIDWTKQVCQFLDAGGAIRILVWNDHISGSVKRRLSPITDHPAGRVIKSGTRRGGEDLNHFYVVGDQAFRKEAPHDYCDGEKFSDVEPEIPAQICFNDPKEAMNLIGIFDQVWEACEK